MKRTFLLALVPLALAGVMAANAAPVDYTLPEETAALKPGPNLEVAQNNTAARALYRGAGWEDVALRKGYYDHGNINGIVMKKGS